MSRMISRVAYIFFLLVFSEDTWRFVSGILVAVVFCPLICQSREDLTLVGKVIVWVMIVALGWSITAWPAAKISQGLRRAVKRISE